METSKRGAPLGNQNFRKGTIISGTIRRALSEAANEGREPLLNIARKLLAQAEEGDLAAAREIFDRLDGKPSQTQIVQGDEDGGPVRNSLEVTFVEPAG